MSSVRALNWEILNGPAAQVVKKVESDWLALLEDRQKKEEDYHAFLAEYAGLFFGDHAYRQLVVSKLRLGAEHVVDFVVGDDRASGGVLYELIELESPHEEPYILRGNPSARLNAAVEQVRNWKQWLRKHRGSALRLLPNGWLRFNEDPTVALTVVLGRRGSRYDLVEKRNEYARDIGVQIRSFDHLTDRLRSRCFTQIPCIVSAEFQRLPITEQRQLANPLYKALTDPQWRALLRCQRFGPPHIVANSAQHILGAREPNRLLDEVHEIWQALPRDIRLRYW